jgi:hypothetical protein
MADIIQKQFSNSVKKDIKYINKDFNAFRDALMQYAQTYFPNSYKDFSAASPGTMFIEQAAYVGDVLSYYGDYQLKESLLNYASERKNVIALANYLGYKTKPVKAAVTTLDVYQLVPSIKIDDEYVPDTTYGLSIREYMQVANSSGVNYITVDPIDFSIDTKGSPREATIYSRDDYGIPQFFLLKKSVKAIAGKITTISFNINSATPYLNIAFPETNVIDILDVRDSDNNRWYQVDYLAQDLIFTEEENTQINDGTLFNYNSDVSKLLKTIKTSRKFTVNVTANNTTYLQFGPGTDSVDDEIIYPSQDLVGIGFQNIRNLNIGYDSSKLLNTNSMGQAPANTTLTVKYIVGGGILSNCPSEDIKTIVSVDYATDESGLSPSQLSLIQTVKNSLRVSNPVPATGGNGEESIDEIRQNALSYFSSQNRTVTHDDYISRIYSLPSKYGTIAKAHVVTNSNMNVNINKLIGGFSDYNNQITLLNTAVENYFRKVNYDVSNPFGINLYLLSYDSNKNLTTINDALLYNLRKYLEKYKLMTDSINIIDGYIINFGIDFKISVYNNYNKRDVLNSCIAKVKNFFLIDKWTFNQPINVSQLELEIAKTEGVQSVVDVKFKNLTIDNGNYSPHEYNLEQATQNKIIYPSLDPSVFEIKYPETDIRGAAIRRTTTA